MSSPYRPPQSDLGTPERRRWRIAHSLVALVSAVVVPVGLAAFVRWWAGAPFTQQELTGALGINTFGGLLAAAAVFRHQRMPLWGAAAAGIAVVLLMIAVPLLWGRVL